MPGGGDLRIVYTIFMVRVRAYRLIPVSPKPKYYVFIVIVVIIPVLPNTWYSIRER
jgi:hypothetical protein